MKNGKGNNILSVQQSTTNLAPSGQSKRCSALNALSQNTVAPRGPKFNLSPRPKYGRSNTVMSLLATTSPSPIHSGTSSPLCLSPLPLKSPLPQYTPPLTPQNADLLRVRTPDLIKLRNKSSSSSTSTELCDELMGINDEYDDDYCSGYDYDDEFSELDLDTPSKYDLQRCQSRSHENLQSTSFDEDVKVESRNENSKDAQSPLPQPESGCKAVFRRQANVCLSSHSTLVNATPPTLSMDCQSESGRDSNDANNDDVFGEEGYLETSHRSSVTTTEEIGGDSTNISPLTPIACHRQSFPEQHEVDDDDLCKPLLTTNSIVVENGCKHLPLELDEYILIFQEKMRQVRMEE